MKNLEIIKLDLSKENEKGSIYEFFTNSSEKMIFIKTKKGQIRDQKYHEGKDSSKFPKQLILLSGESEFHFINKETNEEFKESYSSPVLFKIGPYIWHKITALTDNEILGMFSLDTYKHDSIKEIL